MPRPTLLNKGRVKTILAAIKIGASREGAANAAGIDRGTLYDWIRRGRQGEEPYAGFVAALERQQRAWEVSALKTIDRAARKDWRAAAFKLERRLPKLYGRRQDEAEINRRVEERLQSVLKHAEEEWRRRMVAAGNQPQRLLEGKDDEGDRQKSGGDGRRGSDGRSGVDTGGEPR